MQPSREQVPSVSADETYSDVLARLRFAQKPKAQTPAYLRFVNRPLGGYVAVWAHVQHRTPNQLTAVSALLSLVGIVLVALVAPSWPLGVVVSLLLLAGFAFDSADGQLSRLRGGGSPVGEWLDHVVDAVRTCLLHAAVLVSAYRFVDDLPSAVLLLPLLFLTGYVTLTFATMLRDQLRRASGFRPASGGDSVRKSLLLLPVDNGTLCLTFLVLGSPSVFFALYGAQAVFLALFVARLLVRTYSELKG